MSTVNVSVRKLTVSDISSVMRIERDSFSDAWSENSMIASIIADAAVCFAAVLGGEIIGVLIAQDISGEVNLDSIAVSPEYRGHGVASALLSSLCGYSKNKECELITLEVRSKNRPAIGLYEKFGFERVGLRKRYYRDPDDDAVIMTRFEK